MKYDHLYLPADKTITFNNEDERLAKLSEIVYTLPTPPPLNQIHGYGLPPEEQYWKPPKMPKKLQVLQDRADLSDHQKVLLLHEKPEFYANEIAFIQTEWERREKGFWTFNGGIYKNGVMHSKPIWMTPDFYMYASAWLDSDDNPCSFRMREYKWFMFWQMVLDDVDCTGFNYPKYRREFATTKVSCIRYNTASRFPNARVGLQSKDYDHAKEVHQEQIDKVWKQLPFYYRPVWNGDQRNETSIRFFSPSASNNPDYGVKALKSFIDFKDSGTKAYDGRARKVLHNDEIGKCLKKDTPIIMFDGGIKNVQDIKAGDLLMGEDSTSREVVSIARGKEMMFTIQPNKGMEWGCNGSHILSLKWAHSNQKFRGASKGDVVNISVNDYLQLSGMDKKHLMLYRVGVDYPAREHNMFPYLLGIWLGDGSSYGPKITNSDSEIIQWIQSYVDSYGLRLVKNDEIEYSISGGTQNNHFRTALRNYKLIKNKHIPTEFLHDSRSNRLSLLAGLIDTDGYKFKGANTQGYEIVQKNKRLATDIQQLAQSLGYYCSMISKTATMKRENGTVYSCEVFRITFFGSNLHEIPCQVSKKKQAKIDYPHKNTRNPLHTGFKVIEEGVGDYYGFTLKDKHLFLLSDFTVVHNTEQVDVLERLRVQLPVLKKDGKIIGKMINTSTVDEMTKKGGQNFKNICDESHYKKRNENGRTEHGLYNFFMPASNGFSITKEQATKLCRQLGLDVSIAEQMPNKYGYCNEELTRQYILNERNALLKKGDIDGWIEYCRLYPLSWADCWKQSAKSNNFNVKIIEERLAELDESNDIGIRVGNFVWKDGVKDGKVIWEDNPEGKFKVSYLFDSPELSNKFYMSDGVKYPANANLFIAGGDPFKFRIVKSGKKSKGGGAVFYMQDSSVDGHKSDISEWKSKRFVCTYLHRPKTKDEYGEDMIMMCVYYGCEMNAEINVALLWDYFESRGYPGYLFYKVNERTGRTEITPGQSTSIATIEEIFREYQQHIELHGMRENHRDLLQQCLEIEDDMGDFDLFAAGGYALIGAKRRAFNPAVEISEEMESEEYFEEYPI